MKKSNISIIGLGWLGLPLYHYLSRLGFVCAGSTTSVEKKEQLQAESVSAFQVQLKEQRVNGEIELCLKDSEILILNTPPGLRRNPDSNYVAKIEQLLPFIEASSIEKVLYISSTSVFKDEAHFPVITNSTKPNSNSKAGIQIREVEELLLNNTNFETTILRFAGLVDEKRHPATMMSRRDSVRNPEAPVNLIHREDCIGMISEIINQNKWGDTFNASYPKHETKQAYYNSVCDELKLKHPNFDVTNISKGKLIDGEETANRLNYTYNYLV